jgi:hypothetical protein
LRRDKAEEAIAEIRKGLKTIPSYGDLLGRVVAWQGDWPAAAKQFTAGSGFAIATLEMGRDDEYRRLVHQALQQAAVKPKSEADPHSTRIYLLQPVDASDLELLRQFADRAATTSEVSWMVARARIDKALAEYRLEHFDAAKDWASRAIDDSARLPNQAQAWYIQALASVRQQKTDNARSALRKGDDLLNAPGRRTHGDFLENWSEWTMAEILHREAAELIRDSADAPQAK